MTTKELIRKLQRMDPVGEKQIFIDGCYYDAPLEEADIKIDGEGDVVITYHKVSTNSFKGPSVIIIKK